VSSLRNIYFLYYAGSSVCSSIPSSSTPTTIMPHIHPVHPNIQYSLHEHVNQSVLWQDISQESDM